MGHRAARAHQSRRSCVLGLCPTPSPPSPPPPSRPSLVLRFASPLLSSLAYTHTHTSPLFPSPPSPFSRCHGCSLWSSVDVHHSTPEAPLLFHSTSQSMRACMHVGGWVSMPVCGRVCLVALAVAVARTRESWRALLSIRAQIHRHRHRHARARACAYTVMYNS